MGKRERRRAEQARHLEVWQKFGEVRHVVEDVAARDVPPPHGPLVAVHEVEPGLARVHHLRLPVHLPASFPPLRVYPRGAAPQKKLPAALLEGRSWPRSRGAGSARAGPPCTGSSGADSGEGTGGARGRKGEGREGWASLCADSQYAHGRGMGELREWGGVNGVRGSACELTPPLVWYGHWPP